METQARRGLQGNREEATVAAVQEEQIGTEAHLMDFYKVKRPGSVWYARHGEGGAMQHLDSVETGCYWLGGGDGQQGTQGLDGQTVGGAERRRSKSAKQGRGVHCREVHDCSRGKAGRAWRCIL
jgi:hypothetical protein